MTSDSGGTAPQTGGIIWLGAAEIARRVAAGSTSATEIVEAHIERIESVNPAINSVPSLYEAPPFRQGRRVISYRRLSHD